MMRTTLRLVVITLCLCLCIPASSPAQEDSFEPNATPETATVIASGKPVTGTIFPAGDKDHYRLVIPSGERGLLTLRLDEMGPPLSPLVTLMDGAGKELFTSADTSESELTVEREVVSDGAVVVVVRDGARGPGENGWAGSRDNGASATPYRMTATWRRVGDEGEPNQEAAQASVLAPGAERRATVFPVGDRDWYRVLVPEGRRGQLVVAVEDVPEPIRPALEIRDAGGTELGKVEGPDGEPLRWAWDGVSPGAFLVCFRDGASGRGESGWGGYYDNRSSPDPYRIRVDFLEVPDAGEPNGAPPQATALSLDSPFSATVFPKGDEDWYRVVVPAGTRGRLRIVVEDLDDVVNPLLTLTDSEGKVELASRNPADGERVELVADVAAGTYLARLRDGATGRGQSGWGGYLNDRWSERPYRITATYEAVPDAAEPNETPETARVTTLGAELAGWLYPMKDRDWFAVDLPADARGVLAVEVVEAASSLDLIVEFRDPDGKELPAGRVAPGTVGTLRRDLSRGGRYRVGFRDGPQGRGENGWGGYGDNAVGSYRARIAFAAVDAPREPDDTPPKAAVLPPDSPLSTTIFPTGDVDCFALSVPEGGRRVLEIRLDDVPTPLQPHLVLTGPDGTERGSIDVPAGAASYRWRLTVPGGGAHVLSVADGARGWGENGWGGLVNNVRSTSPFHVSWSIASPNDSSEPDDEGPSPRALAWGASARGTIWPVGDRDRFTLDVPVDGPALIRVLPSTRAVTARAVLQDGAGTVVAQVDGRLGLAAELRPSLTSGRYTLVVEDGCFGIGENSWEGHRSNKASRVPYVVACGPAPGEGEAPPVLEPAVPTPSTSDHATLATARTYDPTAGETVSFHLWPAGDVEIFDLGLSGPGELRLAVDPADSVQDPVVEVVSQTGGAEPVRLGLFDGTGGGTSGCGEFVTLSLPERARHYVRVSSKSTAVEDPLSFSARLLPANPGLVAGAAPASLGLDAPAQGLLWPAGARPAFTVTTKDRGLLRVALSEPPDCALQATVESAPRGTLRVLHLVGGRRDYDLFRHRPSGVVVTRVQEDSPSWVGRCSLVGPESPLSLTPPSTLRQGSVVVQAFGTDTMTVTLGDTELPCRVVSTWQEWREIHAALPDEPLTGSPVLRVSSPRPVRVAQAVLRGLDGDRAVTLPFPGVAEPLGADFLTGYDVVVLEGYDSPHQFGLDRASVQGTLTAWAEGGGRLVLTCPQYVSPGLLSAKVGGAVVGSPAGADNPAGLIDGRFQPWSGATFESKSPCPFELTLALPGTVPRAVDRVAIHNGGSWNALVEGADSQVRRVAVSVSVEGPDRGFRTVAEVEIPRLPDVHPVRFPAVAARWVRLAILSSWGAPTVRLPAVEVYGPESPDGLFGLYLQSDWRDGSVRAVLPDHPLACGRATGNPNDWPDADASGWFCGAAAAGYRAAFGDERSPARFTVTADKAVGKGRVVVDTQESGHPPKGAASRWKIHNLIDWPMPPRTVLAGGGVVDLREPGDWLVTVEATPGADPRSSLLPFTLTCSLTPAGSTAEPNDVARFPRDVRVGDKVEDNLFPGGDEDWFRFNLLEPAALRVTVASRDWSCDPVVGIYRQDAPATALASLDGTLGASYGAGESKVVTLDSPGMYLLRVANRFAEDRGRGFYALTLQPRDVDQPFERNDEPASAVKVLPGTPLRTVLRPATDRDCFYVAHKGGVVDVQVSDVPRDADPRVTLRRLPSLASRPCRILYLTGRDARTLNLDRRLPEGFTAERLAFDAPEAATVWDRLGDVDAVVVDGTLGGDEFALGSPATQDTILAWVEGGGRFLALETQWHGSLVSKHAGGTLVRSSSQWDGGKWAAVNVIDGNAVAGNDWGAWCCAGGNKPVPQELVVAMAGERAVTVDRVRLVTTAQASSSRIREFEILGSAGSADGPFESLGRFEAADEDGPQEFTFPPRSLRYVMLRILSNRGHANEVQLGELIVRGPDPVPALFGVRPVAGWNRRAVGPADPAHELMGRYPTGSWKPGNGIMASCWYEGWREAGFQALAVEPSAPERAVTVVKRHGKGLLALDGQPLGREWAGELRWKLPLLLDTPEQQTITRNLAGTGGWERFRQTLSEGLWIVELANAPDALTSLEPVTLKVEYAASPDDIAPSIVGVFPPEGAATVSPETGLALNVSEPLDPASLRGDAVSVQGASSGAIPVRAVWNAERYRVELQPARSLGNDELVTVTVAAGAFRDLAGRPLEKARTWSFKTGTILKSLTTVTVAWDGSPPFGTGRQSFLIRSSSPLSSPPTAVLAVAGGRKIPTTMTAVDGLSWRGAVDIGQGVPDGVAALMVTARDSSGNQIPVGGVLTVAVDTTPPSRPTAPPAVRPGPGGSAVVTWRRPTGADVAGVAVVRSDDGGRNPVVVGRVTGLDTLVFRDTPQGGSRWRYALSWLDAAGNGSPPSDAAAVEVDATAPARAPAELAAVVDAGRIRLSWAAVGGDTAGYLLWRRPEGQALAEGAEPIRRIDTGAVRADDRPADGTWMYTVAAHDAAGNVGPGSETTITLDTTPASGRLTLVSLAPTAPLTATAPVAGRVAPGTALFDLAVSEPLTEGPVIVVRDAAGTELPVELTAKDASSWSVRLALPGEAADGRLRFEGTALDRAGNRGLTLAAPSLHLDTQPPAARVVTVPPGPGLGGTVAVKLVPAEPLVGPPSLSWTVGGRTESVALTLDEGSWCGSMTFPSDLPDGEGRFTYQGTDLLGRRGTVLTAGASFFKDQTPPGPPVGLAMTPGRDGALRLTWSPPLDEAASRYRVYRLAAADTPVTPDTKPVAEPENPGFQDKLDPGVTAFYRVAAVDRALNVGPPCAAIRAVADTTPPAPPVGLQVASDGQGRFRLTWREPGGEPVAFYRVYRSSEVLTSVTGLRPLRDRVEEPFLVDSPSGEGTVAYGVTAVDLAGNEGAPAASKPLAFDTAPPVLTVALSPASAERWGVVLVPGGKVTVSVTASEVLSSPPILRFRPSTAPEPLAVALKGEGERAWRGVMEVPAGAEGSLGLSLEARDRAGNPARVTPDVRWVADTRAPAPVTTLSARPRPGGRVALTWALPDGESPREPLTYLVYREAVPLAAAGTRKPVATVTNATEYLDTPPDDGTWRYVVVAVDGAGNRGEGGPAAVCASDGSAPPVPTALAGEVGKTIRLSWKAVEGASYQVLRARAGQPPQVVATVSGGGYEDLPSEDGTFEYRLVAVDASGNESGPSAPWRAVVEGLVPSARVTLAPPSPLRGPARVDLDVSCPVADVPELVFTSRKGVTLPVRLVPVQGQQGRFSGSLQVTGELGDGPGTFSFSATSREGVPGSTITSGSTVVIDTRPPRATVTTTPRSPVRPGPVELTVELDEEAVGGPGLFVTLPGRAAAAVELAPTGPRTYRGRFDVPSDATEGRAVFELVASDAAGNRGGEVGGGRFMDVDVTPPKRPFAVSARSRAGGEIDLAWEAPRYGATDAPESLAGYRVVRSAAPLLSVTGADVVTSLTERAVLRDRPPSDGTWYYGVIAVDRAGFESPLTTAAPVLSRRTPPPAPQVVTARTMVDAVEVDLLSSRAASSTTPVFNVYSRMAGGATQAVARGLRGTTWRGVPPVGGEYWFTATELDELGNESQPSEPLAVVFRKVAPVASVRLDPPGPVGLRGAVILLSTSVALVRPPELALEIGGGRVALPLEGPGPDGVTYQGRLQPPPGAASGSGFFRFRGVASVEGREVTGVTVGDGERCLIDATAPTFRCVYAPSLRDDRGVPVVGAGVHDVTIVASELLAAPPRVVLRLRGSTEEASGRSSESREEVLTPERVDETSFRVRFTISDTDAQTDAHLLVSGTDRAGNEGDIVTRGGSFRVDTVPPRAPNQMRVVAMDGGRVRIEWTTVSFPDGGLDRTADRFSVYRATKPLDNLDGVEPLATVDRTLGVHDAPTADAEYFYAVRAIDRGGNMGPPTAWASVTVDRTPPSPPRNLAAKVLDTGVVELTWDAPEGERPLYYNAYIASRPIVTSRGLAPMSERIPFTRVYGTPNDDGVYHFAVTAVDANLNESEISNVRMVTYRAVAPMASFKVHPDIWVRRGTCRVDLATSEPLGSPPRVEVRSEHGTSFPLTFTGAGKVWRANLTIGPDQADGTYGFVFRGEDADGNLGTEIAEGPLFHVDTVPPLPPGTLTATPEDGSVDAAVRLAWKTPKRSDQVTEVPYFYRVYRSREPLRRVEGLVSVGEVVVEYRNLDDYAFVDVPPADGTWYYAVTSLDLARNESEPGNLPPVTVTASAPRAVISLTTDATGVKPTDTVGKGVVRVALSSSVPLAGPPELTYELVEGEDRTGKGRVELTGSGTSWSGILTIDRAYEYQQDGTFRFRGRGVDGVEGTRIAQGGTFVVDTVGPVAEIIVPSISKYEINYKTNALETPPIRRDRVEVSLTTQKPLASAPDLSYEMEGGRTFPVPLTGFGTAWRGYVDTRNGHPQGAATWHYRGVDRTGNDETRIAPLRKWFRTDDNFPTPRVLESFCSCGPRFSVDTEAPDPPMEPSIEVRKLGVAVISWKEPAGSAARYRLYRDLTPVSDVTGRRPVRDEIFATVIVDAPPCDGNWFYAVTALDLAGNESAPSPCVSMFVDSIKPELKIKPVPEGDDFFIVLEDEVVPPSLSLTLKFPGGEQKRVALGGTSGELKVIQNYRGTGKPAVYLPQKVELFNGTVQVVVHSPDPAGNIVDTTVEMTGSTVSNATGGTVSSADERVTLEIPPGLEPVIPKGPNEVKKIGGYENLYFITHANIPDVPTVRTTDQAPSRNDLDPLPPGLEVVSAPYTVNINYPPTEPMELKGSASQADLSGLKALTAKLRMKIPTMTSEVVEDVDYLKSRLKVLKWVPATKEKRGRWQPIPDEAVIMDPENHELIVPADSVTTYVIVSEKTPPSIRDMTPPDGGTVLEARPVISALIVDKGTGVATGAENRVVLRLDGRVLPLGRQNLTEDDPTEVRVTWQTPDELPPGSHVVALEAEDVVGNRRIAKWRFTIDNKPPRIRRTWPPKGALASAGPLIVVLADDPGGSLDPTGCFVTVGGRSCRTLVVPELDLLVARPSELPDGVHQVVVTVRDGGGKIASSTWPILVDRTPPVAGAGWPTPNLCFVADRPAALGIRIRDALSPLELGTVGFYLDGRRIPKAGTTDAPGYAYDVDAGTLGFTPANPPASGAHRLEVVAVDAAGNSTSVACPFTTADAPASLEGAPGLSDPAAGFIVAHVRNADTLVDVSSVQAGQPVSSTLDRATGALLLETGSADRIRVTARDTVGGTLTWEIDPMSGQTWFIGATKGTAGLASTPWWLAWRRPLGGAAVVLVCCGALYLFIRRRRRAGAVPVSREEPDTPRSSPAEQP